MKLICNTSEGTVDSAATALTLRNMTDYQNQEDTYSNWTKPNKYDYTSEDVSQTTENI